MFFFGAGVSADADVPVSSEMVKDLEKLINENKEWKKFKDLYFLVKSGVEFSFGVQGRPPVFNIEVLVNILNELEKKETHPLYPFIGAWHVRFNEVIGNRFSLIKSLRTKIVEQLKSWVNPQDLRKADYLKKLSSLKREINFPLRIFSLNYDLLVEKKLQEENLKIERGFEEETREWNYKRFIEPPEDPDIYLYKLHGSIDWARDKETQVVRYIDSIPQDPDLIFGTQYKMQYIDPYLFMISEFRYYCLKARVIVCLGYSFSDDHINSILAQSLKNPHVKIHILAFQENKDKIKNILKCNDDQLDIRNKKAKEYFEDDLKLQTFANLITENNNDVILK